MARHQGVGKAKPNRRDDLVYAALLSVAAMLLASAAGSPLHLGAWYVLAVPMATMLPGLILRAPALFLTGSTAAALASLIAYQQAMSNLPPAEGLFGLGHVFSLPGMLLGTSLAVWLLKYRVRASVPWIVAGIGFVGAGLGFIIAQMLICATLMHCGALSLGL
jgi:predicted membrane protein